MPITRKSLGELTPYENNARTHPDGQIEQLAILIKKFGFHDSHAIAVDEAGVILWGHGRLLAAKKAGLTDVPVEVVTGLSDADKRALRIADNGIAEQSDWDLELLRQELEALDSEGYPGELLSLDESLLEELGDVYLQGNWQGDDEGGDEESDGTVLSDKYTKKVQTPIYEITGEYPAVSDLFDDSKTKDLIKKIDNADIPPDVAEFLRVAAMRHTVLTFDKIAEFYAHAPAEIQELMEDSALVIIDFNKAIEDGYVKLSDEILAQYREDYPDAE